jgi:hypothetical protein
VARELNALIGLGQQMLAQPDFLMDLAARWLWVRDRDGVLKPLIMNAAQLAFEESRGRQNIVLKARQMGMTTWIAARFFLRTILMPGTMTVQVAHTQAAAEAIFRMVHRMWEHLPDDLREGPLKATRASAGRIVFGEIDSEYRVWSAGDESAGRGLSIRNLHCSEVSRWPGDVGATLAGLRAALAPDGELVLESTPNGAYGAFYEEWCGGVDVASRALCYPTHDDETVMNGAPEDLRPVEFSDGLVQHFFPWWMEPAYVGARVARCLMREDEVALVEREGLTEEQIGFRRGLERSYGGLRLQEFAEDAETCFRATGACCFEVVAIEQRLVEVSEPVERRRGGALLVWLSPQQGKEYCVAVDTAGGGEEGDFAAVQVVEMKTGLQCAELQERLRPVELARVVAELAREYGGALVAVERNNHGAAVIAYLESTARDVRLWRERGSFEVGWLTTSASKPEMVARMGVLLSESAEMFKSRRLLGECRTFVAGDRGKFGAASGSHDDLVMAMCVAQSVRAERVVWG